MWLKIYYVVGKWAVQAWERVWTISKNTGWTMCGDVALGERRGMGDIAKGDSTGETTTRRGKGKTGQRTMRWETTRKRHDYEGETTMGEKTTRKGLRGKLLRERRQRGKDDEGDYKGETTRKKKAN